MVENEQQVRSAIDSYSGEDERETTSCQSLNLLDTQCTHFPEGFEPETLQLQVLLLLKFITLIVITLTITWDGQHHHRYNLLHFFSSLSALSSILYVYSH